MERPVSETARPLDVARTMVARGATRDAMVLLRGALARDPKDGDLRFALTTLERGEAMPPGPTPPLDLALVDGWIREGHLVEALALLGGLDLGGPSQEWANLLGELLAPVPAHAEIAFVAMHRELLSGGASLALSHLEDRERESALPGWAERRLSLLRWMLLDNAQDAPTDQQPIGDAPTALAGALRAPFSERNLDGVLDAARRFASEHPDDADARAAVAIVTRLSDEMTAQLTMDLSGYQTVPVAGRPAAAMQLRMANLDGAASIYRGMAARQPGDDTIRALVEAVSGLQRLLEGRPVVDRSFPPPPREVVIVGASTIGAASAAKPAAAAPKPLGASPATKPLGSAAASASAPAAKPAFGSAPVAHSASRSATEAEDSSRVALETLPRGRSRTILEPLPRGASPTTLEPLPRRESPTILEPVPSWERAAEMFAASAPGSQPPGASSSAAREPAPTSSSPPASAPSFPPPPSSAALQRPDARARRSASEMPPAPPAPTAAARRAGAVAETPKRSTAKLFAHVEPDDAAGSVPTEDGESGHAEEARGDAALFDDRTENEDSYDDLAETGSWSLDSATFDLSTKKTALAELDPLEAEATRAVANPLAVFEDETAAWPVDAMAAKANDTGEQPDQAESVESDATWIRRPSRPTVPLGSSPPPPMPRSEVEMKRADDPDPTLYEPTSVVVHPIRPIGVGGRRDDGEGGGRP